MANAFSQLDTSFPSMDGKNTEAKIQAIQDYLYQLLEQLRYTLNNLNPDNFNATEVNDWADETITKPIHAEIVDTAAGLKLYVDQTASGITIKVEREYAAEWTDGDGSEKRYYLNDFVKVTTVNNDQTETIVFYKCIYLGQGGSGHVASADNKPGSGQHWEDYWVVVDAEAVAYSRFDINADMIRSEVGRAENAEQSIITQTADNINAAVSGIYATDWVANTTYYETNIVKITTVNNGVTTNDYYKCILQHTSAAANKPPNATYWESVSAPNVQSVLDIGLNGITLAYDNTQTGGETNASYIKLHKDGIDMGGGLIKVTNLDASTITTGTLNAGEINLDGYFEVYDDGSYCGSIGGYNPTGIGGGEVFLEAGGSGIRAQDTYVEIACEGAEIRLQNRIKLSYPNLNDKENSIEISGNNIRASDGDTVIDLLQPCLPMLRFTDMAQQNMTALLGSLNANNVDIPLGPAAVLCGSSTNPNKALVLLCKASNTLGNATVISPYSACNGASLNLSSSGWTEV